MKKWILVLFIIVFFGLPIWVISRFAPLSSYEPGDNVSDVLAIGWIPASVSWYLIGFMTHKKSTYLAFSPYFFGWSIVSFIGSGYYSFSDDETIRFSILLSRAAIALLIIAVILFLFESFCPDRIRRIEKWICEIEDD